MDERVDGHLEAPGPPLLTARFEDPQAHDVLQQPGGAEGAALVAEVVARDLGVEERRAAFDAHERPGSRGDVGPSLFEGRPHHGAPRVVGGGNDDVRFGESHLLGHLGSKRTKVGSRRHDRREQGRRNPESFEQLQVPAAVGRAHELRGRGVRVLRDHAPAEEVVDEVGKEKEVGGVRGKAFFGVGEELVDGVEHQELDAGTREDLGPGHPREHLVHHAARAVVAVGDGVFDELARGIDQAVVDGPPVDSQAPHRAAQRARPLARLAESRLDLGQDAGESPSAGGPRIPGRDSGSGAPPRAGARPRPTRPETPARCRLPGPPRSEGVPPSPSGVVRDPVPYLRKPSCKPPSTGTTWPVVFESRFEIRRKIASAWSSGSMGDWVSERRA